MRRRTKAKPARKRNPDTVAEAAALSEAFHGRPARRIKEYDEPAERRVVLTELGPLRQLDVELADGNQAVLSFAPGVKLMSSVDGGQLYITGGDQELDLKRLGLADKLPKDHLEIGRVSVITYHTRKAFDDFTPVDYVHQFGEEGGDRPILGYDVINSRLYLIDGSYQVKPEGISN